MALALGALTDWATLTQYPGMGSLSQGLGEQLINEASDAIATYCDRTFEYTTYTIANPDKVRAYGMAQLQLSTFPLQLGGTINTPPPNPQLGLVTQITEFNDPENPSSGYLVPTDEYEFWGQDGAQAGILYRQNMWGNSGLAQRGPNFTNRPQPYTEEASTWAVYSGGFLTKPQCYGGAGGQTWAYPGANELVALGTLLLTGTAPNQVLWQSVPNGLGLTTGDTTDTTGPSMPSFPTTPTIGQQVVDGTVAWMALGLAGAAGLPVAGSVLIAGSKALGGGRITLPPQLEQACIKEVLAQWRGAGRDPNAVSQSLLGSSVKYADPTDSGLCPAAERLARPWKAAP